MKSAVELNRLFLKFILLCQVKIHKNYCENIAKFNFLGIICASQRFWGVHFIRLSKGLKSKILRTRVPPPGYAGFITNLPFWAARRLERMSHRLLSPKLKWFLIFNKKLQFSDICVSWSSPKTDLRIKFLNLENGSLENISFSY